MFHLNYFYRIVSKHDERTFSLPSRDGSAMIMIQHLQEPGTKEINGSDINGTVQEIVCFFFSLLKCIIVVIVIIIIVIGASVAGFNALDFSFVRSPFFYDFNVISLLLFQFLCSIKRRENEDVTRFLLIFLLFFFALSLLSLHQKKKKKDVKISER